MTKSTRSVKSSRVSDQTARVLVTAVSVVLTSLCGAFWMVMMLLGLDGAKGESVIVFELAWTVSCVVASGVVAWRSYVNLTTVRASSSLTAALVTTLGVPIICVLVMVVVGLAVLTVALG